MFNSRVARAQITITAMEKCGYLAVVSYVISKCWLCNRPLMQRRKIRHTLLAIVVVRITNSLRDTSAHLIFREKLFFRTRACVLLDRVRDARARAREIDIRSRDLEVSLSKISRIIAGNRFRLKLTSLLDCCDKRRFRTRHCACCQL